MNEQQCLQIQVETRFLLRAMWEHSNCGTPPLWMHTLSTTYLDVPRRINHTISEH
jgi:hypothetical protein